VSHRHTNTLAPQLWCARPANLGTFRAHENEVLTTYGVADRNAGAYRIPIEKRQGPGDSARASGDEASSQ
jgi:hypothetical protein